MVIYRKAALVAIGVAALAAAGFVSIALATEDHTPRAADNDHLAKAKEDIEDMQIDLQFRSQKLQKEVQDKRQEILQALAPKFDKVLKDIIQVDQIDLILAPNSLQYANSKHDITRRVTEKLNEQRD